MPIGGNKNAKKQQPKQKQGSFSMSGIATAIAALLNRERTNKINIYNIIVALTI